MSFTKKNIMPPIQQAVLFAIFIVCGMLGAKVMAKDLMTIWLIGASFTLLYAIMNNGLSIFAADYKKYLIHSIYSFMLVLVGSIGLATILSGVSVFDAETYRTIYIVILAANFIFISMVMMIKGLLIILSEKDKNL